MIPVWVELVLLVCVGGLGHWLYLSYRRLYRRQVELAQTRTEVLATLTHELRSPLFAAQGTIENMLRSQESLSPEQMRMQLEAAGQAISEVNREVERITQLFRLESGKLQAHTATVQLQAVFNALRSRHPESACPDHRLEFQGGDYLVEADQLLLTQALDNLVVNALRHTGGGLVEIVAEPAQVGITITVQDQGPGINPGDHARVFERYEKGDEGTPGFGIGLFLAREYLRAQKGELNLVPSEQGARFILTLPRADV